jgi:hypothetical protein
VSLPLNAGKNTIEFSNSSAYAPDFDAITVPTSATSATNTYLAAASANTLAGGAVVQSCSACTGGEKVGYVGNGSGTLTFNDVDVSAAGVYPVQIVYCDGTSGDTGRSATFTVNGTVVQTNVFTPTGGSQHARHGDRLLPLKAGENTIEISNGSAYAPDFSSIVVDQ